MTRFDQECWQCDVQSSIECGSKGGSQPAGNTTVTQNSNPWSGQQPALSDIYSQAQNIGANPLQYPTFPTYAAPTSQQTSAVTDATNLAQNNGVTQGAVSGIQPYLNGSMLSGGNPYLQSAFNSAAQTAIPATQSGFEANGRYGSGALANAQTSALTNLAGNMAYNN